MTRFLLSCAVFLSIFWGCSNPSKDKAPIKHHPVFTIEVSSKGDAIHILKEDDEKPILTQVIAPNHRPYLHPIVSPDGSSTITEFSPGHHKHQTGIYWGFTRVNGRDFFHHPEEGYWRKVADKILQDTGTLKWSTTYEMLDSTSEVLLTETQIWSFRMIEDRYVLDLEWQGNAAQDVTIGAYDYGGLFIRMPWKDGMAAKVTNAARDNDQRAEGKRAMWLDVGMQLEGRTDMAHVSIFDHPQNAGFPQPWRVDGQFGVGPARTRLGDWKIPKGHTEIIKHRLEIYEGDATDLEITDRWGAYSDQDGMYSTASLWGIAQKEGREAKFLTPEAAIDEMTMKEGFLANIWAAEPDITQPMAFCWDHRGRLWVAENRDYESRGHGFSNSGDSRILILEDTDHDGKADSKKVFLEGIAFPAAMAVGFEGLFLGAPPHLLFVPDHDGDDKADMDKIEVRLTGWGIRDRHETLNSLHWGPDGWLYGCQGFATPSRVRKPTGAQKIYGHKDPFPEEIDKGDGTEINGGIWRYHPTKERFEVVAHGFSNPWGIDYDANGQLFISACVIPHIWHVIPGGIYHRQGGQHFSPYVYQDIKTIADHRHRSAHGGARIYLSDAFPAEQQGRIFMANIHEHAVLSDVLTKKGSGFTAQHGDDFLLANNAQWIGFSLEIGPDGGLYVLDWHDADICGKEVLNKETGRIFRIMPESSNADQWRGRYDDLTKNSDIELARLLPSPSAWHSRRARLVLQERAVKKPIEEEAIVYLNKLLDPSQKVVAHRLNALWTLHSAQLLPSKKLQSLLDDKNEYIRAWAIQLLCEDGDPGLAFIEKFTSMAKADPSPTVRLYLASALQRIEPENKWKIAQALLERKEDIEDHNIPSMLWFGIEPMVGANPQRALADFVNSKYSTLNENIARRLVDGGKIEALVDQIPESKPFAIDLLSGMIAALEGRTDISSPKNWKARKEALSNLGLEADTILEKVNQLFGDQEVIRQLLATLKKSNDYEEKLTAIEQLSARSQPELLELIPTLLKDEKLRIATIKAVAQYDSKSLGQNLLENYDQYDLQSKTQIVNTLASRPTYGWLLTQALADERISRHDIPTYLARQLRRVVGSGFVEVWGPIEEPEADLKAAYAHYREVATTGQPGSNSMLKGKALFDRTCGPCHKMNGEGGSIGPDITGSNRTDLEYLLGNILEPSAEIQDDYLLVVVTTRDGRTIAGNKVGETDRQIKMRVVGQDDESIFKTDIQSMETTSVSMMPQGLLQPLSDEEVINLLNYLMHAESI